MSGGVRESEAAPPSATAASARQQGVVSGLFKVMSIVAPRHAACALQPLPPPAPLPPPSPARAAAGTAGSTIPSGVRLLMCGHLVCVQCACSTAPGAVVVPDDDDANDEFGYNNSGFGDDDGKDGELDDDDVARFGVLGALCGTGTQERRLRARLRAHAQAQARPRAARLAVGERVVCPKCNAATSVAPLTPAMLLAWSLQTNAVYDTERATLCTCCARPFDAPRPRTHPRPHPHAPRPPRPPRSSKGSSKDSKGKGSKSSKGKGSKGSNSKGSGGGGGAASEPAGALLPALAAATDCALAEQQPAPAAGPQPRCQCAGCKHAAEYSWISLLIPKHSLDLCSV